LTPTPSGDTYARNAVSYPRACGAAVKALSLGKTVTAAAADTGLHERTYYRLRRTDPAFAVRWQAVVDGPSAQHMLTDPLEVEAQRRAVYGTEKPIVRGGTVVGHTTDYSDSMLMFLLKARYPEKYDRSKVDPSASTENLDIAGARDALLSKFAQAAS
jgi:hypothetical protein